MEDSVLEDIGLSKGEVKAYRTLLVLGESKVGPIIEKSNMASSAVHNSINSLVEKGLVSFVKKGKIKYYQAVSPNSLLNFMDEKKKRVENVIPELESIQKHVEDKQGAEIFEGTKGVISMLNMLIEDAKKGDEYLFFAVDVPEKNEEIQKFFSFYDAKRRGKGLITKGIAPKELKKLFFDRKYLNMRYTEIPIISNTSICNNKIALFSWEEKPVGYLINSKQVSQAYKRHFNSIWKIAKK